MRAVARARVARAARAKVIQVKAQTVGEMILNRDQSLKTEKTTDPILKEKDLAMPAQTTLTREKPSQAAIQAALILATKTQETQKKQRARAAANVAQIAKSAAMMQMRSRITRQSLDQYRKYTAKSRNHGDPAVRKALENTLNEFDHKDVKTAAFALMHQYINKIASKADELP